MVLDFIEILKVIFLGIVEGITEWLPISSTGHMLPLRRTTGGSTITAWEEFDKNRAFIRPERKRYELETGKDCCGAGESPQKTR